MAFFEGEPPPSEPAAADAVARRTVSRRRRRRDGDGGDLGARILIALPAIAFAIFIVLQGGIVWALGIAALGIVALHELFLLTREVRPPILAGFIALVGVILAAHFGDQFHVVLALAAAFPLIFFFAVLRPRREGVAWAIAITFLGVLWIGLPMAHAVLLRELDHGAALVTDVLIGTFIGDTAAYFGGRAWGRRPLAPLISPSKTLEGLVVGVVGGTLAFWGFAFAYQDWFAGRDAIVIGLAVALAAPIGDLFESLVKRDLAVKDTGRFFGAHGGVLDRLDAVLFSLPVAYYVALAVL